MFVDDDLSILQGLKGRLYRQRKKWDMLFVSSGREALAALEREPVDVIVSDMRMPEMDGATLLKKVRDAHPRIVRIVLSGHAELESTLRAVPVAHQFLSKPCEPGVLENVVERACSLQALISEEVVQRVVGRIDRLPSAPRIHTQLVSALTNDNVSTEEIARILKQDVAMCAKTLQMVNSAFFRLSRTISRIEEAVAYLGFSTIKQVVLVIEVFQFAGHRSHPGISLDTLQAHSMLVGNVAAGLFRQRREQEDAVVAGLLHDVGKLILGVELPEETSRVLAEMSATGCAMHVAEQRVLGVTHAEVGAYLLGLWGLPYPLVEAVANHHAPSRVDCAEFGVLAATHVADSLVHDACASDTASDSVGVDLPFLERIGVKDRLPEWTESARRLVEGPCSEL